MKQCCICSTVLRKIGHDPAPVWTGTDEEGRPLKCCDRCFEEIVLPIRKYKSSETPLEEFIGDLFNRKTYVNRKTLDKYS